MSADLPMAQLSKGDKTVMTFKKFLLMLFVLTPLAAVQTVAAGMALIAFFISPNILIGVIGLAVTFFVNTMTYYARYGGFDNILFWILDLPLAVLRLPLTIIADILAIFSLFTDLRVDPNNLPDLQIDGFKGYLFLHYLMLSVDTSAHDRRVRRREQRAEASDDPRRYKLQNIWWQIKILFLTLLHSVGAVAAFLFALENAGSGISDAHLIGGFIGMVATVIVYLVLAFISGSLKGLRGTDEWYDNETVVKVSAEYSWWRDEYVAKEKVVKEAGWRHSLTPGMIVYMLLGWLWVIPQAITVVIAILTPPYSRILPCRGCDINFDSLSFTDRVLHFLFGFITDF